MPDSQKSLASLATSSVRRWKSTGTKDLDYLSRFAD